MTPGSEPGWRKVDMGGGTYILAPDSDEGWAEGLEGLAPQVLTAIKNYTHFVGRSFDWGLKNYNEIKKSAMYAQIMDRIFKSKIKLPPHRTKKMKQIERFGLPPVRRK